MSFKSSFKDFVKFLKKDTWQSWLVSLIIAFVLIKFIFFPVLSFITGTSLPLVVVESCSMYHSSNFDSWWNSNGDWYSNRGIQKEDFEDFGLTNGLNKGDVVFVVGKNEYKKGDIIIFNTGVYQYPLIHRIVKEDPFSTKGDNGFTNPSQLPVETNIEESSIFGKAVFRIPGLGWAKLIFFEWSKPENQRGFCK